MVDQVNIVSVSGLPYEKKLQGIDNLRKLIQRVNFVIRKTDSEKIEKKVALSSRKVEVKNPSILSKFLQRIYNYVASVFKSLHGAKLF